MDLVRTSKKIIKAYYILISKPWVIGWAGVFGVGWGRLGWSGSAGVVGVDWGRFGETRVI